jgi:hypothetical protein
VSASEETAGPHAGTSGDQPVSTLRGAGVQVDAARAAKVAIVLGLVVLVVVAVVLLVAGYRKNAQITELRTQGVPVELTVTHCLGLMGGSGSNVAGYACSGTYSFGGRTYAEDVPDNALHLPGTKVRGVVVSSDPGLFSTPASLANEHASASVYIAPIVLLLVAAGTLGWLAVRRRRRREAA